VIKPHLINWTIVSSCMNDFGLEFQKHMW